MCKMNRNRRETVNVSPQEHFLNNVQTMLSNILRNLSVEYLWQQALAVGTASCSCFRAWVFLRNEISKVIGRHWSEHVNKKLNCLWNTSFIVNIILRLKIQINRYTIYCYSIKWVSNIQFPCSGLKRLYGTVFYFKYVCDLHVGSNHYGIKYKFYLYWLCVIMYYSIVRYRQHCKKNLCAKDFANIFQ